MITYDEAIEDADEIVLYVDNDREINGLFTNGRVDRSTIPDGYYIYDFREGEDGVFCSIENTVVVNHAGSFITDTELDLGEDGKSLVDEDNEWGYSFI
jgi:hypothetical protein